MEVMRIDDHSSDGKNNPRLAILDIRHLVDGQMMQIFDYDEQQMISNEI